MITTLSPQSYAPRARKGFPGGTGVMNLPASAEDTRTWVQFLGWEDPWRRKWQPTPVFLPGEFHGQRSQAGYSPSGHKESDMTECLNTAQGKEGKQH